MGRIIKKAEKRKREILDKAQELFNKNGYEATSVAQIIKELNISKGAFYHYYNSKIELLEEIAEKFTKEIITILNPIVDNKKLNAIEKLNKVFESSIAFKSDNIDILYTIINTFYSDKNLLLREKMNEKNIYFTVPIFTKIFEQGKTEGSFDIIDCASIAKIIMFLAIGMANDNVKILKEIQNNPTKIDQLKENILAYQTSIERILGAPENSLNPMDLSIIDKLQKYFDKRNDE